MDNNNRYTNSNRPNHDHGQTSSSSGGGSLSNNSSSSYQSSRSLKNPYRKESSSTSTNTNSYHHEHGTLSHTSHTSSRSTTSQPYHNHNQGGTIRTTSQNRTTHTNNNWSLNSQSSTTRGRSSNQTMTPNNNSSNDVTYESARSTQTSRSSGGGSGGKDNFQSDRNTTYNNSHRRPTQEYITQNNDENMRRSTSQNHTTRNSSYQSSSSNYNHNSNYSSNKIQEQNHTQQHHQPSLKELHKSLEEYCTYHTQNNGNDDDDNKEHHCLNTSFSIASTMRKQRKLLSKIVYELQTASQKQWSNNNSDTSNSHSKSSREQIELISMTLSRIGGHCNTFVIPLPKETNLLMIRVLSSVSTLLMEEYCSTAKHHHDTNNDTDDENEEQDENSRETIIAALEFFNVTFTCLECHLVYACLRTPIDCTGMVLESSINLHDDTHIEDDEGDEEKYYFLMDALLYFVLAGNQTPVESPDRGTKHGNNNMDTSELIIEEDGNESMQSDGGIGAGHNNSWDDDNSISRKLVPYQSKIQGIALCTLTKAILCVEFIQRYCSSVSLLPTSSTDSALGKGMGINFHGRNVTRVIHLTIQYLCHCVRNEKQNRRNDQYTQAYPDRSSGSNTNNESKRIQMIRIASINLITAILRIDSACMNGLFLSLEPLFQKLVKKLLLDVPELHRMWVGIGRVDDASSWSIVKNSTDSERYIELTSSISLLMMIQWKYPQVVSLPAGKRLLNDQVVSYLITSIFSRTSSDSEDSILDPDVTMMDGTDEQNACTYSPILSGCAHHLLIHLCMTSNDLLKGALISSKERMKKFLNDWVEDVSAGSSLSSKSCCHYEGVLSAIPHLLHTFPLQYRDIMNESLNQGDSIEETDRNERFINGILSFSQSNKFTISAYSMILMRIILNNDHHDNPLTDNLTSYLWQSLHSSKELFQFSRKCLHKMSCQKTATKYSPHLIMITMLQQPILCVTVDLFNQLCKSDICCDAIIDALSHENNTGMDLLLSILEKSSHENTKQKERLDRTLSVKGADGEMNNEDNANSSLLCAVQLGTGAMLGRVVTSLSKTLLKNHEGRLGGYDNLMTMISTIRGTLSRFVSEIVSKEKGDIEQLNNCAFIELLISQSASKDLTKRAVQFEASVGDVLNEKGDVLANAMFACAINHKANMEHSITVEQELDKLREEYADLRKERENDARVFNKQHSFYEQEIARTRIEAKASAMDMVEAQALQKKMAERQLHVLRDRLEKCEREKERQNSAVEKLKEQIDGYKMEVREQGKIAEEWKGKAEREKMEVDRKKSTINELKAEIEENIKKMEEKDSVVTELKIETEQQKGEIETLKGSIQSMENTSTKQNDELVDLKKKLDQTRDHVEESFFKLTSLAQLYEIQEKENKNMKEKNTRFEEKMKEFDRKKKKYDQLEEKYRSLEKKYRDLKQSLERERTKKSDTRRQPLESVMNSNPRGRSERSMMTSKPRDRDKSERSQHRKERNGSSRTKTKEHGRSGKRSQFGTTFF